MAASKLPARSPQSDEAELLNLIESFAVANQAGDRLQALRLIDRAWRMSSRNPEINYLYGQLRFADGDIVGAIRLFEVAAHFRSRPDYDADYILALCANGQLDTAMSRLRAALKDFAVTEGSALAAAARAVTSATIPRHPGWIGIQPDLRLHGEAIGEPGNLRLEISTSSSAVLHDIFAGQRQDTVPFTLSPPDSTDGILRARLNGRTLIGGMLPFPPDFGLDGRVELSESAITGWAALRWNSDWPIEITLMGASGGWLQITTTPDPLDPDRQLFSVDAQTSISFGDSVAISVAMPDGRSVPHPASPFFIKIPQVFPKPIAIPLLAPARAGSDRIDILIALSHPLVDPLTAIRTAIETADEAAEIIVIDDACRQVGLALDALAATGAITLLRNAHASGFSQSINRGLRMHDERDVVILSAGAEVFPGWLSKLRSAAYAQPMTGTATVLTNFNAAVCYPVSENCTPNSDAAAEWNNLAAANNGTTFDLPFGTDTCLYIRRDCLNDVGELDAEIFPRGFGGDRDFCRRASDAGWRHVLAADIFVRHIEDKALRVHAAAQSARSNRLLRLRYPDHPGKVVEDGADSPSHLIRRALDEARLFNASQRYVLYVSHRLGGGVARAINDRIAQSRGAGLRPIILKRDDGFESCCRVDTGELGFDDLYYDLTTELPQLTSFLGKLVLDHVELHHFIDLPGRLIDALYELPCPTDIKVHDYVWYCPRVNLLDGRDRYCGEPDAAACQSCINANGSYVTDKLPVSALLDRSTRWLGRARTASVPTEGLAARMHAKFPKVRFQVEPLEETVVAAPSRRPPGPSLKVAVLGALGENKGFSILLEMARDAAERALPIEFVVIGFAEDDTPLVDTGKVFVTGEYAEFEIGDLIAREKPDLALFLSQFPETWCYTLTHALRANLPIAGFDFGAIAERLRALPSAATLFPLSTAPSEICDILLAAFYDP